VENNDQKISINPPQDQTDLFQRFDSVPDYLAENAPDLDIEQEFMGAIKYCLRQAKKHGLSRDRIVERMNLCLPESLHITKRQLDAWCAESKEYHLFPAIYVPAFIWAVRGLLHAITVIAESIDLVVLDRQEQLAVQLGKAVIDKTNAAKTERTIKQLLRT